MDSLQQLNVVLAIEVWRVRILEKSMEKTVKMVDAATLQQWILSQDRQDQFMIIDVREPDEFAQERIAGAVNVPLSVFTKKDFSADQAKAAVFHCRVGGRTRRAEPLFLATPFKEIYCL